MDWLNELKLIRFIWPQESRKDPVKILQRSREDSSWDVGLCGDWFFAVYEFKLNESS